MSEAKPKHMWTLRMILTACRSEDEHDPNACLIWRGGCSGNGLPQIKHDGKMQSARRVVWSLDNDKPFPAGRRATMRCMEPMCLNPAHIMPMTRKGSQQLHARFGAYSRPDVVARRIRGAKPRHDGKLDATKAAEIRESAGELSAKQTAAKYGISTSMVHLIRQGRSWKPTTTATSVFNWRPA